MHNPVKVGITHGDINGIGYEVILGALADECITELFTPVIFGDYALAEKARSLLNLENMKFNRINNPDHAVAGKINIIDVCRTAPAHTPGKPTPDSGKAAVDALEAATAALVNGHIDVLVTAPISKEAVHGGEFMFPGHTEYLESKAGNGFKARMVLFNGEMRVALLSTHLPVAKIAGEVTAGNVDEAISSLVRTLRQDFGIERPRIAVLSLNPHAGDGGVLGTEETDVISPAIARAREAGTLAFGPYAADGFFGAGDYKAFDGILAMYHDQGLAPFKTIAGQTGVNFTAGLPFVRTSPDHGTAFPIAWQGKADPTSMREAIYRAIDILRNRTRFQEWASNPLKKHVAERPDKGERQERPRPVSPALPPDQA